MVRGRLVSGERGMAGGGIGRASGSSRRAGIVGSWRDRLADEIREALKGLRHESPPIWILGTIREDFVTALSVPCLVSANIHSHIRRTEE